MRTSRGIDEKGEPDRARLEGRTREPFRLLVIVAEGLKISTQGLGLVSGGAGVDGSLCRSGRTR